MRFAIPEMNMESLEKKMTKIRNKCAKYGCAFHYERVGEHFEEREFKEEIGIDPMNGLPAYRKWKEVVKFIDIDVEGTSAVNGWKFAASLEYTEEGNIITGPGEVEIPEKYYSCKPWCEHCKTARDRRHSYIVYKEDSGEFKQVGKSCLKDFTGGMSAEWVALFESFIKECGEASEFRGLGGIGASYFNVEKFMVCAAEAIRLYGYQRRDYGQVGTGERAEEIYRDAYGMRLNQAGRDRVFQAKALGLDLKNPKSVELAKAVREWIAASDRDDNYFHNLKVACALEYGDYKVLGLLASSFTAYDRQLEFDAARRAREADEAEARAKSSWMGEAGDKVSFEIAACKVVSSWNVKYGGHTDTVFMYKFADGEGREAIWKTTSRVDPDGSVGGKITGKIKGLNEWHGIKQTELTRCKVVCPEREKPEWKGQAVEKAIEDFLDYCDNAS